MSTTSPTTAAITDPFEEFVARSLARPGVSREVEGAGTRIHYLEWAGPPGAPALLLLHGFLGHAHWWDFVAPWLAEDYRVIAPDFSGMGDSGHRKSYRITDYIDEIGVVMQAARITPCSVIGHSFGGRVALLACREFSNSILRGVVVDSRLVTPADPMRAFDGPTRTRRRYATLEDILPRFRLQPDEPAPALTLAHLARQSVKREQDGWTWKFDDQVMQVVRTDPKHPLEDEEALLADLATPIDIIFGEHSKVVNETRSARLAAALRGARRPIVIPTAHHHVPVGQPLALLAALRALLVLPKG